MTGPTPVTATHLIVARYHVDTFEHKLQMYCNALPSADPSGYDLIGDGVTGNPGFSTVVDPMFNTMKLWYDPTVAAFVGMDLYQKSGSNYLFLTTVLTTIIPTGTTGYTKAAVTDFVGKAPANRNLHTYLAEGGWGVSTKITSPVGQPASYVSIIDYFWAVTRPKLITDAANWRKSRGGHSPVRWLAAINDSNEKLRRLRGIK